MSSEEPRRSTWGTPQAILGLIIVAYGLLMTADNLGWIQAGQILRFWPVALVVLGVAVAAQTPERSGRVAGLFIAAVGAVLTLARVSGVHFNAAILWPIFLVVMGIVIMLRGQGEAPVAMPDRRLRGFAFWSGTKRRVTSPLFERADFTAVMGGVELDLTGAAAAGGEAVVDVFVVMGGLSIRVPPDWNVANEVVAVMGGVDDKSVGGADAKNRLVLRGFLMMGGIEIKS